MYLNSSTKFKMVDFTEARVFSSLIGLSKLIVNLTTAELDTIFIRVFWLRQAHRQNYQPTNMVMVL
jgi:hypothetical protein